MARYIDADKLIEALQVDYDREGAKADDMAIKGLADASVKYSHGQFCYLNAIERVKDTPTADVVPKSEVEELTRENESLAKTVNEASELIRKLRSKIDELKKDRYQVLPDGRIELLPRTDIEKIKTDVAREIFKEIDILGTCNPKLYAKLKKKYTEDQSDG